MGKQVIQNYTFNTGGRTVTLNDFGTVHVERLALITDTTTNQVLYNFADNSIATATVAGNVITLSGLPSGVGSSDKLRIDYNCLPDDPVYAGTAVSGDVASGVADSGEPVKVGGVYHATAPTFTDGQRGDVQVDSSGRVLINPAPLSATVDSVAIGDGSTSLNILVPNGLITAQTGQNGLIVAPTGASTPTLTLTDTSPATVWYDLLNYPWISLEVLTNTSGATLTFQTSGDSAQTVVSNTNLSASDAATGTVIVSTNGTGNFQGPRTGRYFRVSSNLSTGNTASLVITFYTAGSN